MHISVTFGRKIKLFNGAFAMDYKTATLDIGYKGQPYKTAKVAKKEVVERVSKFLSKYPKSFSTVQVIFYEDEESFEVLFEHDTNVDFNRGFKFTKQAKFLNEELKEAYRRMGFSV